MHRFSQVDVFTDRLTAGNPVAVVHDADDLSEEQLAAFANWTNLSETTFLLRPTDPAADYRLRIFTTSRELPFAGHPTLGSARAWLAPGGRPRRSNRAGPGMRRRSGPDPAVADDVTGRLSFAAPPLLHGGPVDPADLRGSGRSRPVAPIRCWTPSGSTTDPAGSDYYSPTPKPSWSGPGPLPYGEIPDVGVIGPHPAGPVNGSRVAYEVRAFVPGPLVEDPVTGSLNASLAQWLIGSGQAPAHYVAAQGSRLGRAGRIDIESDAGQIWVGGDTVIGISGTVAL